MVKAIKELEELAGRWRRRAVERAEEVVAARTELATVKAERDSLRETIRALEDANAAVVAERDAARAHAADVDTLREDRRILIAKLDAARAAEERERCYGCHALGRPCKTHAPKDVPHTASDFSVPA